MQNLKNGDLPTYISCRKSVISQLLRGPTLRARARARSELKYACAFASEFTKKANTLKHWSKMMMSGVCFHSYLPWIVKNRSHVVGTYTKVETIGFQRTYASSRV